MDHQVEPDTVDIKILEAHLTGKDRTDRQTVVSCVHHAMKQRDPETMLAVTNILASLTYLSLPVDDKHRLRQWCTYHRDNPSHQDTDTNHFPHFSTKCHPGDTMPIFINDLEPYMKRHFIAYLDTHRFWANLSYVLKLINGIGDWPATTADTAPGAI